jgi:hypothetical protein
MYKIIINYGGIIGKNDPNKAIEVIVYHPDKSQDGTHISASSIFNANMIRRLSQKAREDFINSLIPSLETCMKEVDRRKELELNDR